MKYIGEILWYLALPVSIALSYYAVLWGLKVFHKRLASEADEAAETVE